MNSFEVNCRKKERRSKAENILRLCCSPLAEKEMLLYTQYGLMSYQFVICTKANFPAILGDI